MGCSRALWAFLFASVSAFAADPIPNTVIPNTPLPNSPFSATGVNQSQTSPPIRPTIVVPTPDTIPAPSETQLRSPEQLNGQFRSSGGQLVKLDKLFLNRYQHSVVRVIARDLAGNELSRSMGVGIGKNGEYIAAPLSIILGNSQQWADKIEITHSGGNKYNARISLIDEEKNIVLLSPETNPAPIPFVRDMDQRPQIEVLMISFEDGEKGKINPVMNRGKLAAANSETGLMSISSEKEIKDTLSGTAVINTAGELVGMLLPSQRGVLSSALNTLILKANKAKPIEPSLVGMILGRGVLVDAKIPGAFRSIASALEGIKKGEWPKADPTRYTPAKVRTVAPKENDKVVIKVMPGTYREGKTISIPSNLSLSGSGAENTVLLGTDPAKPVVLAQNVTNAMISGFRIVPAPLQQMKAPTLIVSGSRNVQVMGNVFEAKGGVGLWVHESKNIELAGNIFTRGKERALSCDRSNMLIEANGFLGDWPIAISADRGCVANVRRNLFLDNKTAITLSAQTGRMQLQQNTFIRAVAAVKVAGESPNFTLADNLFFECTNGLYASAEISPKIIGRNAVWNSKMMSRGHPLQGLDLIRSEPKFAAPESYDFRIVAGRGQLGSASKGTGLDIGAFQTSDILGPHTQKFLHALSAATANPDLPDLWAKPPEANP